jgi:hypothetical protein
MTVHFKDAAPIEKRQKPMYQSIDAINYVRTESKEENDFL